LSVLHYVFGALQCLGGLALLFLVALGGFMNSDWLAQQAEEAPPEFVGGFLQLLGWVLFGFVEVWGIMNLVSGHGISMLRNRTFSQVTAAFNCLSVPFGLGLGIYTFVVLNDREVAAAYGLPQ
jgi:hypothetical protein